MDSAALEKRLDAIDRRLDALVEHMEATRLEQRKMQELKADVGRIATEVFEAATTELEEVAPHFDNRDLVHLVKKLLRNTRNLNRLMDRLEGLTDFVEDAAPLQKDAFLELLSTLEELDRKGYFTFLRELGEILDRVVTTYSVEDVRLLGDNVVTILDTIRGFTQPELLRSMNNALAVYRHLDADVAEDVSFLGLLRAARSPEVRRGLLLGMTFLRSVSAPPGDETAPAP